MATIYCAATSLDGYIADDEESLSWLFETPAHDKDPGGRYGDDATLEFDQFFSGVGAVVCGANTYAWVHRELTHDGSAFAWPYEQPSWIVTHRELDLPKGVTSFAGDVRELHAAATEAAGGKDVWIVGGGDLAGQFADAGLLDKVWVHQTPVTLGAGPPCCPGASACAASESSGTVNSPRCSSTSSDRSRGGRARSTVPPRSTPRTTPDGRAPRPPRRACAATRPRRGRPPSRAAAPPTRAGTSGPPRRARCRSGRR